MTMQENFHILSAGGHTWHAPEGWHSIEKDSSINIVQGCGEVLLPCDDQAPPKRDYSGQAAGAPARHSCDCSNCKTPCNVLKPTTTGWEG